MKVKLLKRLRSKAQIEFYVVKAPLDWYFVVTPKKIFGEPYYGDNFDIIKSFKFKENAIAFCNKLRRECIVNYLKEHNTKRVY